MPIKCLGASLDVPDVNRTLPLVGVERRAAMRNSVVFPAPLGPSRATNSPGEISSETPRRARSEPKRFSIWSNETPRLAEELLAEIEVAGTEADSAPGKFQPFTRSRRTF